MANHSEQHLNDPLKPPILGLCCVAIVVSL